MSSASPLTIEQKTEINIRFQRFYDEGVRAGRHGHYETMFGAMHEAYAEYLRSLPTPTVLPGVKE